MKGNAKSLVSRVILLVTLVVTGTVVVFAWMARRDSKAANTKEWQQTLEHEANLAALRLQAYVADVARDARYLAANPRVRQLASNPPAGTTGVQGYVAEVDRRGQPGTSVPERAPVLDGRQRIQEDFHALMQSKPAYAQVRLIVEAGEPREVVRLDRDGETIRVTPNEQLQPKGDRDYIRDSRNLGPDEAHLSEIDLNRDFGVITQPYMPNLRAVAAVFQSDGTRYGWIVINADLRPVLTAIEQQHVPEVRLYLANSSGSFLLHPNSMALYGDDLGLPWNYLKPSAEDQKEVKTDYLQYEASHPLIAEHPRMFHIRTGVAEANTMTVSGLRTNLLTLLVGATGVIATAFFTRLITARLRRVTEALGNFEKGQTDPLLEQPADEAGQLAAAFNRMSTRIAGQMRNLEDARQRADEAAQARDDFLAVMSHEIRTPLNAVTGLLRVLERNHPPAHQEPILRSLRASTRHLTALLNDALDWSRLKAGKLTLEPGVFPLRELLQDLAMTHHPLAAQKGLQWEAQIDPTVPAFAFGDAVRLAQVLTNLLDNAVKFTDTGCVILMATWEDERLRCEVQDSGIGIGPEDIGRIFSPFDQAHGNVGRRLGGAGLGLAITRSLVEAQGGTLEVTSRPGEGSNFILDLPCPIASPESPQDHSSNTPNLKGRHLLGVEDSPTNREVLASLLEETGATITLVGDGAAALEKLAERPWDLALFDLQLPDTNGLALAREAHRLQPALPLIAVTAQVTAETRADCLAGGFLAVVPKPVAPQALFDALARYLPQGMSNSSPTEIAARLFPGERDRQQRVLTALAADFATCSSVIAAAVKSQDTAVVKSTRHRLHSGLVQFRLTELTELLAKLTDDWSLGNEAVRLMEEASRQFASARAPTTQV